MDKIEAHTDKLECYTCHATWAPQCYGCHVKIDYSQGKQNPDYLAASHAHDIHGNSGEDTLRDFLVDGKYIFEKESDEKTFKLLGTSIARNTMEKRR